MTEVRPVVTYLGPNEVARGLFTYEGDTVTIVTSDGSPTVIDDITFTEKSPPEHAEAIAKVLIRRIRKALLGGVPKGFEKRRLDYNHVGIV